MSSSTRPPLKDTARETKAIYIYIAIEGAPCCANSCLSNHVRLDAALGAGRQPSRIIASTYHESKSSEITAACAGEHGKRCHKRTLQQKVSRARRQFVGFAPVIFLRLFAFFFKVFGTTRLPWIGKGLEAALLTLIAGGHAKCSPSDYVLVRPRRG